MSRARYPLPTDIVALVSFVPPANFALWIAIRAASADWAGSVVPTALLGHAKDPGAADFVERTVTETCWGVPV